MRAYRKGNQEINFTANIDRAGDTAKVLTPEQAKERILYFSVETVNIL